MSFRSSLLAAVLTIIGFGTASAQTRLVTGRVTDSLSSDIVVSGQVSVQGTTIGTTITDDGTFTVAVPTRDVVLTIRSIGFKRQDVTVSANQNSVNVALGRDFFQLEAIVVTGQATGVEKRNLANAVATVTAAEIAKVPSASIEQMLQGKMAGVLIQENSGQPGGGSRIQLRGTTSLLGAGTPLYVLDGVIVSDARISGGINAVQLASRANLSSVEQMAPINRIADLNPNDIASVEVLKGASAAAIYGSKASGGVILITTKRGRVGAPRFQIKTAVGMAQRAFTHGNGTGGRVFQNLADAVDAFPQAVGPDGVGGNSDDYFQAGYTPIVFEDQLSGRKPIQTDLSASMSGGTETTQYFASALFRHEPGIVIETFAQKASLRLNLDQQVGDRFKISTGAQVIRTATDRGMFGNDNSGTSYYFILPHHPNFFDLRAVCPDGSRQVACEGGIYPDNPFSGSNPLHSAVAMQRDETVWRVIGSGRADLSVLNTPQHTLNVIVNGGVDQYTHKMDVFSPPELMFEDDDGLPGTVVLSWGHNINTNVNSNLVYTFRSAGGGLQATTSLGSQFERVELVLERSAGRGLVGGTPSIGAATARLVESDQTVVKDLGFFAQEEILINDRLLATVGGRADKSSNNSDIGKFYFYPKASIAYRLTLGNTGFVNEVKFRGAWGQSGNQPLFGQKFTNLEPEIIEGLGALRIEGTSGNVDAKPERQTEFEGGIDAQLAQGRVLLEVTLFHKRITDALLRRPLAPTTGFDSELFNGGKFRVNGLETVLSLAALRSATTSLTFTGNFTLNRSKVLELPLESTCPFSGSTPCFQSGGFTSQFAVFVEEGKSISQFGGNDTLPGAHAAFTDSDPNTVPQTVVRAYDTQERKWQAGLVTNFQHKALGISMSVDAVKGGHVNLGTWRHWDGGKTAFDFDDINPETGLKLGDERRQWRRLAVDTHSRNASHIKMRELKVSLDLPRSLTQQIWGSIRTASISLSGRNLITNQSILGGNFFPGNDPATANYNSGNQEMNNIGRTREFASYPSSRSFWFSVDLGF